MCRDWVSDIGLKTNIKTQNTLFSPVVGRVGIFLSIEKYLDGKLYEVWITKFAFIAVICNFMRSLYYLII